MISSITIYKPSGQACFTIGAKVNVDGVETKVEVVRITENFLGQIVIYFSNGNHWKFNRLPYIAEYGNVSFT